MPYLIKRLVLYIAPVSDEIIAYYVCMVVHLASCTEDFRGAALAHFLVGCCMCGKINEDASSSFDMDPRS